MSLNLFSAFKKTARPLKSTQQQSFDLQLRKTCIEIDRLLAPYKAEIKQWMHSPEYQRYR